MVKFSHSLQFNTVPDWADEYIAYANLKKTLYAIEKYNVQSTIQRGAVAQDIESGMGTTTGAQVVTIDASNDAAAASGGQLSQRHVFGFGKNARAESKVASAAAEAAATMQKGGNIFPPESAAFEQGLYNELNKISSFYIRKEQELSVEMDAVERQWEMEDLEEQPEEQQAVMTPAEFNRRKSMAIDDEKQLERTEKDQLKEMMGWEKDGLQDTDTPTSQVTGSTLPDNIVAIADEGAPGAAAPTGVSGQSVAAAAAAANVPGYPASSGGDVTDIVWRRGAYIDSVEGNNPRQHRRSMTSVSSSAATSHPFDVAPRGEGQPPHRTQSQHSDVSSHAGTRHASLDYMKRSDHVSLRRTKSTFTDHRKSVSLHRRSRSIMRDFVTGNNVSTPHNRPEAYAPLTREALLRRRLVDTYMLLSELKSYVALNYIGFQKILKKHDKVADTDCMERFMKEVVDHAAPYLPESRQQLDDQIVRLQALYARTCCDGNMGQAAKELRSHLREFIVWERNTIWRDMVAQERKVEVARAMDPKEQEPWYLFGKPIRFVSKRNARNIVLGLVAGVLFAILMNLTLFDTPEQNKCFAILITIAFMWATEVFPLFVTALFVPMLTIWCQVMRDPTTGATLSTHDATSIVFGAMFSPTIMLLLGGFTIASALSKYGIAKAIASTVLSKAGTDPKWVLLVNMFVATIASMFISNVAAPVLCFSLIQTILRTLPHKARFAPCLILGIALASNVGGMASPISSPQNIITIQNMSPPPSWGQWFAVSIPLCIVIDVIIWAYLMMVYRPHLETPQIATIRATKEKFTWPQIFICCVTVAVIILWCIENQFQAQFGDMGVIAILPLVAFFGTNLLTKDDFNNFLWTVIMLAMGGIALGKAVDSSGLLDTIAHHIEDAVDQFSVWVVLAIFSGLTLIFATFVSHTVAAVIILPIVQHVGNSFADPHPRILVMGTGLVCSAAMGLPVSGYPNMNAISLEDEMGVAYLKTTDFLRSGVPLSIVATLCVISLGYGIMTALGM
ncbi:low-affinity phosphate transporter [Actinomortierella ambigua]|nr:low-affinity phosphate transporter [Actinomortierella ambigua]